MKRFSIMGAAILSGALALSVAPDIAEAKGKGKGAKTTAGSASGKRPANAVKYSKKITPRAPARSAASVLKQRAKAEAPRNIVRYKSRKATQTKSSAKHQMSKGTPAKAIANTQKPGALASIANWFRGLFSGTPKATPRKATPRKVTFRERRGASVQLNRLIRTPSGRITERR